jgi:hypothetical protein
MHKIVEIDPYFPTGEASIQPVVLWANGKPCYEQFTKHASVANDYFKTITPIPGHSIVYVLALGSWEFYGENRNGDGFPESPYMSHLNPPWISDKETLVQHYKSFESAHNFRHHVNKDPQKAVGKVLRAFWNPTMHRVELVVDLDNSKAPDLAERIAAGEFPPVSMGTRVPFDRCTICGNTAPTRAQYCNHLKFQMKEVIDGKKVAALNPSPKFFDISWVFRPADATAFMLKKVANNQAYEVISGAAAGEYLDGMEQQKLAAKKLAVIDKVVRGVSVDSIPDNMSTEEYQNLIKMRPYAQGIAANTPDLPEETVQKLASYSLPEVVSSAMAVGGMQLSAAEFLKVSAYKQGHIQKISQRMLDNAGVVQSGVIELLEDHPQIMEQLAKTGALAFGPEYVRGDLTDTLTPFVEKRGGVYEYLKRRAIPEDWKQDPGKTTQFTLTDPATGEVYATTRGAAIRSHDDIARANLLKTLGGAALLGGAYKLIGSALPKGGMSVGPIKHPLLAAGLAAAGYAARPTMGKHYMTDQGVPVPITTELSKMSSVANTVANTMGKYPVAIPTMTMLGIMAALAYDQKRRSYDGVPLGHPGLPLPRRMMDTAGEFTSNHPIISLLGGSALLHKGLGRTGVQKAVRSVENAVRPSIEGTLQGLRGGTASVKLSQLASGEKIASILPEMVATPDSAVTLPEVDLDKLAEWLGWIIVDG